MVIMVMLALGVVSCEINESINEVVVDDVGSGGETRLVVYNDSKDTVLVYLTLGVVEGCVGNVREVDWVQDTVVGQRGLQGTFVLMPQDSTAEFGGGGLGFDGVLSFNFAPDNCVSPSYTNGLNQFEFIVNNGFQAGYPQETVDISCVHGVNCVVRVELSDSNWTAGPVGVVQSFANTMDRSQVGIAGVYPYGCDTCTGSKRPPSCIKLPQPAQKRKICNVQRGASLSGGLVKVRYLGKVSVLR